MPKVNLCFKEFIVKSDQLSSKDARECLALETFILPAHRSKTPNFGFFFFELVIFVLLKDKLMK